MNIPAPQGSAWRKSSYSGNATNCVEVSLAATAVAVRDTKHREGGTLVLPASAWNSLRDTLTGA